MRKECSAAATRIVDVGDELLIEIFVRLACFETVIRSKFVCKKWLSLLSNPRFVIEFIKYKKSLPPSEQEQLPWTFLHTMRLENTTTSSYYNNNNYLPTHKVFSSPKFSLKFLPFEFIVAATFKDLVLCLDASSSDNDHQYYVVCNPITKQWIKLPPNIRHTPHHDHNRRGAWARLICEDSYYDNNKESIDYRFRVVVVDPTPPIELVGHTSHQPYKVISNLLVLCSEDFEWRKIDIRVPLASNNVSSKSCPLEPARFRGVVCKGMVCFEHQPYFGMFNPFDVTPTSATTLEARALPTSHITRGSLVECGGQLILITGHHFVSSKHDKNNNVIVVVAPMVNFRLDLNKYMNDQVQVVQWSRFCRCCSGRAAEEIPPHPLSIRLLGMHPNNWTLLYGVVDDKELILFDMRSLRLKRLGTLVPDHCRNFSFYRTATPTLELQHWPTPLPTIPL